MFELIIIVLCLVLVVLLARLHSQYRKMDDEQVLRYTRVRAVLKKETVDPEDASGYARLHKVYFSVIGAVFFLVAAGLTFATMKYITKSHPSYLPYVRITSRLVVLDAKLLGGVLMILSFWALFIALFLVGRTVTQRECGVVEQIRTAGEKAAPEGGEPEKADT